MRKIAAESIRLFLQHLARYAIAGILGFGYWQFPHHDIFISPETTFFTEPLQPNGEVDYCRIVDERAAAGIESDRNAVVALLEIVPLERNLNEHDYEEVRTKLGMTGFAGIDRDVELISSKEMLNSLFQIDLDDDEASDLRSDEFHYEIKKPWGGSDHPEWEQVILKQQVVLDQVVEATLCDQWYWPVVKNTKVAAETFFGIKPLILDPNATYLTRAPIYHLNHLRWCAESLAIRSMYKVNGGDTAGAIADLKAVRRLSRLVRLGHETPDRIIAEAITEIVQDAEIELIVAKVMSVEQLRDYSDFLLADKQAELPNHELAKINERLGLLEMTHICFRFDVDPRIFSLRGRVEQLITPLLIRFGNINAALREMNQQYSQFDKVSESSVRGNRAKNLDTYVARQKIPLKGLSGIRSFLRAVIGGAETRGKMAAQLIASERLSPLAYLEHKNSKRNVAQSLIITSIAIELFRHENGEYPPSLDLITSIDIDQFSRDWFADGKFVYHKTNTGFMLYSIGPDGVDSGGANWLKDPGGSPSDDLRVFTGEMPNRK